MVAADEQIQAIFRCHNLRCTPQRLALYRALQACRTHPTAEELYRMVKPSLARLSLATVYNTLDALCRVGLCRKMPTTNGCCRFDANTGEHMHLRYHDTGEVRDVPADVLDRLERECAVTIDRVSMQFIVYRDDAARQGRWAQ